MVKRLKLRKTLNRYDKFNNTFYQNVQKGFLRLAKNKKNKYLLVDSNQDINKNKLLITSRIRKLI